MKRFYKFTVTGKGRFPIDMLRHDQCFPLTTGDAQFFENSLDPELPRALRHIELGAVADGGFRPTEGRWDSFGWHIHGFDVV
jgi:hypothetical protein